MACTTPNTATWDGEEDHREALEPEAERPAVAVLQTDVGKHARVHDAAAEHLPHMRGHVRITCGSHG
eukprot:7261507-Prymnesium_polylepis.1